MLLIYLVLRCGVGRFRIQYITHKCLYLLVIRLKNMVVSFNLLGTLIYPSHLKSDLIVVLFKLK